MRRLREARAAGISRQALASQTGLHPNSITNLTSGLSRPEAGGPILTPPSLTTREVREMREMRAGGMCPGQIAAIYRLTRSAVSAICSGKRYPTAPGPITRKGAIPPDMARRLPRLAASGLSARQIAAEVGLHHKTVTRWLAVLGSSARQRHSPISPQELQEAARMRAEGMTWSAIGAALGRNASGVRQAVGRAWPAR
ncbi:MAG: hypothetical protein MUF80_11790 [Burkholderiales bacterium]|nr:hypothetical protein [Burkholderiales bacterium]